MALSTATIKLNSNITTLFDKDFLESVKSSLDFIIKTDDSKKAFELYNLIEKALIRHKDEMAVKKESFDFYNKAVIKAKFIALPLLDDKEVVELIKNYFTSQFGIEFYDVLKKLKSKFLSIELYEDRDKLKENLKRTLLENKEIITSRSSIKMIGEWLRNYNVKLGTGVVENIKKSQYLIDLKKIKELNDEDREKLKILFDFYEKLKLSSFTPQGFEEDIPIVIDDKFYIFKQGELEAIGKKAKKARTVSVPPKTQKEREIEELNKMAIQYAVGSLERKVVEEEIKKLGF